MLLFFFNDTATTELYTLSLHDALPISLLDVYASANVRVKRQVVTTLGERAETSALLRIAQSESDRTRSEEHTSELQSLAYLVCRLLLEKKKENKCQQLCHHSLRRQHIG